MIRFLIPLVFLFSCSSLFAQFSEPNLITNIDNQTEETSGLVFHNNELWTHNDSGGDAKLYSIDTITGNVIRTVSINGAENNDWEDICKDGLYLYIGDFGNNSGQRDDLLIYRISLSELEDIENTAVNADQISFAYNPEIYSTKPSHRNNTNFDCEAMIAFEDSLYLFSKNWVDNQCYLYALPKTPGNYTITPKDTINTNGLVCGADYDEESNTIVMIGYQYGIPAPSLIFILSDFYGDNFFSGTLSRMELSLNGCQTEGVIFRKPEEIWFSNEKFLTYNQGLYSINYNEQEINNLIYNPLFCNLFPNPAKDKIKITFPCKNKKCKIQIKIYNIEGKILFDDKITVKEAEYTYIHDISDYKKGKYVIHLKDGNISFQTSFIKL